VLQLQLLACQLISLVRSVASAMPFIYLKTIFLNYATTSCTGKKAFIAGVADDQVSYTPPFADRIFAQVCFLMVAYEILFYRVSVGQLPRPLQRLELKFLSVYG
jgi:hypothetical protein